MSALTSSSKTHVKAVQAFERSDHFEVTQDRELVLVWSRYPVIFNRNIREFVFQEVVGWVPALCQLCC